MSSPRNDRETVLITGGAGFIGSHLVGKLINEGVRVIVLDDLSSGTKNNIRYKNVEFVRGDVRDVGLVDTLVKKSDVVFHLAEYIPETRKYGLGHVIKYSVENPILQFDISCGGTLTVLDKCRKYDKKIVFASSAAVYGESKNALIEEESPTSPSSPYGASKLCAETYVKLYSKLYEVPATILRIFNAYGPRQNKYIMHDILLKLTRDSTKLEILGSGQEERDFIFVSDVVDAMLFVASSRKCYGEVFNVGTGRPTSTEQLIKLILEILDTHPEVIFTQTSWKGDVRRLVADISKIRNMGFEPKYLLKDGLKELVKWYKDECFDHFK